MLPRLQCLKTDVVESKTEMSYSVLDKLPRRHMMSNYILEMIQVAILKAFITNKDTYFYTFYTAPFIVKFGS